MPSRSKKKLSRSPVTPPTPCLPSSSRGSEFESESNNDELRLQHLLSRASAMFPNFINKTAFVGRISDRDLDFSKGNQARVWLSEPAMVSSSIAPGSLVSVSFPASGEKYLHDFPLDSLSEECAEHFGVDVDDNKLNEAGNYFAIATVFPSRKVLKYGVRLSWGLSCTTSFPAVGRPIFVFPMRRSDQLNIKSTTNHVLVHKCKDLYLTLVPPKDAPLSSCGTSVISDSITSENGMAASPKTPSFQTKLSSPSATPAHPSKSHGFLSTMGSICSNVSSVKLALTDEKAKELMQASAARWLHGRCLLVGNIVTVPLIFGQICLFVVEGADKLLTGRHSQTLNSVKNNNLLSHEIQGFNSWEAVDVSLLVESKTTVHLQEIPDDSDLPEEDHSNKEMRDKEACDTPRLGGLSKEYTALKEIIMFSLVNKGHLPRYKGVLLHGPPGTGKTSLATSCALDSGASLFSINGPEIVSKYYGESEQALHEVFDSARRSAPAVIFIDELDAIAPARKDGGEELSLRMVATLLKLMDEIKRDDNILVLAATNRPDSIDPAMRRPGRLDREIEIGVPSPDQRLDILRTLLQGMDHSLSTPEIQTLASLTHGFVGADVAALCNEAAITALRRHIEFTNSDGHSKNLCTIPNGFNSDIYASEVPRDVDGLHVDLIESLSSSLSSSLSEMSVSPPLAIFPTSSQKGISSHELARVDRVEEARLLKVTMEDFEKAKMKVRPSAMREVMLELPKVRWEDVGGQEEVKKQLIEAVQWPQICPDAFKRMGIRPPRGLLMIGPPGCSKTLMARAVASEAKLNFLAVKGPELFSKWVGESEKAVRSLFTKARANSPAIIFFDEIDGLAISRGQGNDGTSVADRVLSQLLMEMDGLDQRIGVTVIAATNRPDKIDPALLRPGRFDRLLDVQPPDEADREDVFRIHTKNVPCHPDVSMKELARLTEGYTGADIKLVCREAAVAALEEDLNISEVSMEHFKVGIGRVQPSDVLFYRELALQFRRIVDSASLRNR